MLPQPLVISKIKLSQRTSVWLQKNTQIQSTEYPVPWTKLAMDLGNCLDKGKHPKIKNMGLCPQETPMESWENLIK